MSTAFQVYSGTKDLPTFRVLIDRAAMELHQFLDSIGIQGRPRIHLRLQACAADAHIPYSLDDRARWNEETYAWFMVGDVPGGTDAYFDDDAKSIQEYWQGELDRPGCRKLDPLIRHCINLGHCWHFRRSAGQPAIVNLAYGLIAGSLAAVTDGFVYSDDSAWDWQQMPALPEEFLKSYFRRERTEDEDRQSWIRRSLEHLPDELREGIGLPGNS